MLYHYCENEKKRKQKKEEARKKQEEKERLRKQEKVEEAEPMDIDGDVVLKQNRRNNGAFSPLRTGDVALEEEVPPSDARGGVATTAATLAILPATSSSANPSSDVVALTTMRKGTRRERQRVRANEDIQALKNKMECVLQ